MGTKEFIKSLETRLEMLKGCKDESDYDKDIIAGQVMELQYVITRIKTEYSEFKSLIIKAYETGRREQCLERCEGKTGEDYYRIKFGDKQK